MREIRDPQWSFPPPTSLHGPGCGGGGEGDGGRYGRTSGREARTPPSNGEAERPKRALQVARRQAPKVREGEWGKGWGARGRVDGRRTNRRGLMQWGRGGWRACNPEKGRRRRRDFPNPGLEVGVEIRDLRQGAGSQDGIAEGIDFCDHGCFRGAMPTLLATLPPRFKHLPARSSCTPATVRCVCLQNGSGVMCVRAAGGGAHLGLRSLGGRRGSPARCPLAELGLDPVRRQERPSCPLLRA